MSGIMIHSKADYQKLKETLNQYFLVLKDGIFQVATYDVTLQKQNEDDTCMIQTTINPLDSGDLRFKKFAEQNHKLAVEVFAHKAMVADPELSRADALAEAEKEYASVVS